MRSLRLCSAFVAFAFVAGCNSEKPVPTGPPIGPTTDPNDPERPQGATAKYSGIYKADAPIDFTQNGVLPGMLSPALGALTQLHDNPGKAIVDAASASNGGGISSVPDFLRSVLANFLTTEIKNWYAANPTANDAATLAQGISEISHSIDVHGLLTVHTPATDMTVQIEQQVTDVGFALMNQKVDEPVPTTVMPKALAKMPGALKAHADAPIADADITLTGGTLSLPLGSLMLQALSPLLFQPQFGTSDLNGALAKIIPCAAVGAKVAGDVGTPGIGADLVTSICMAGVSAIGDQVSKQISAVASDVTVLNGHATLYDVSMPHPTADDQADRIADGTWTWRFGTVDIPSTFAGDRVGDAY
jgi:hypothetical protein